MENQRFIIKKCNFAAAPVYLLVHSRPMGCKEVKKRTRLTNTLLISSWFTELIRDAHDGIQWKPQVSFTIDLHLLHHSNQVMKGEEQLGVQSKPSHQWVGPSQSHWCERKWSRHLAQTFRQECRASNTLIPSVILCFLLPSPLTKCQMMYNS